MSNENSFMTEDEIELEKLFKNTINYFLFYEKVHDFAKEEVDLNGEEKFDAKHHYVEFRSERFVITRPNEFAERYFKGYENDFFKVLDTNFYERFLYVDKNSSEIIINEQPFLSLDENFKNLLEEGQIIDEHFYRKIITPFLKFYQLILESAKELKSNGRYGIQKSGPLYCITKPERFINAVAIKNLKYSDYSYNHNIESLLDEVSSASKNYSRYFVNRQNVNGSKLINECPLNVSKKERFLDKRIEGHFFHMMNEYSSELENSESDLRFKILSLIDKFLFMKVINYLSACFDTNGTYLFMLKNTFDKIYIDLYELIKLDEELFSVVKNKYKKEWRLLEFKRHSFSHPHEINSIHYDDFNIHLDFEEYFDDSWLEDKALDFFLKVLINDYKIADADYYYSLYCVVVKDKLIDSIRISKEYIPFIKNVLSTNEKNISDYILKIEFLFNKKLESYKV